MKRPESLYTTAPELPRPVGSAGWELRACHDEADIGAMQRGIAEDLAGGVTGLLIERSDALARRLEGVDLGSVAVSVHTNRGGAAERLLALGPERGCLGFDPLSAWVRKASLDLESSLEAVPVALEQARPGLRPLCVDTSVYDQAGASDAFSLALALASMAELVRSSSAAVMGATEVRLRLRPTLFANIARLRATRLCLERMAQALGVDATPFLHVQPSLRWLTVSDPHVNLLRNTAVVTSGALGGADAITSLRLESVLGDELARRVARNTQLVLQQEAHLGASRDPAGGSYAVETLTRELAEAAWGTFQALEAEGGVVQGLRSGRIADRVRSESEAELEGLRKGAAVLLGVTRYPPPEGFVKAQLRCGSTVHGEAFPTRRLEDLA